MFIEFLTLTLTYCILVFFIIFVVYLIILSYKDDKKNNQLFSLGIKRNKYLKDTPKKLRTSVPIKTNQNNNKTPIKYPIPIPINYINKCPSTIKVNIKKQ
jgi:preprotein translocase subunit SecG